MWSLLTVCVVYVSWYIDVIFFFKQKTAYEMGISDWSSDVCSSDLTQTPPAETGGDPLLSVVVPVLNEQDNVAPLVAEIRAALAPVCTYEIVYVDDGSADRTAEALAALRATVPELRVVRDRKSTRLNSSH